MTRIAEAARSGAAAAREPAQASATRKNRALAAMRERPGARRAELAVTCMRLPKRVCVDQLTIWPVCGATS